MTDNTSYREKGRAVFLAAIMVLSMVAGAAVLTGSAAAQDTTVDKNTLGGETFFGQEVEINNLNSSDNTVQLRSGDSSGENSLETNLNTGGDSNVTIDTSTLENGQYYIRDDDGPTGSFEVLTQDIDFAFASDSVTAGPGATLNFADDNRAETVNVTVDAGGDLSASDLSGVFSSATTEETSENNELRLVDVTVGDSLDADFTGVAAGNYSFNFEVDDTGATDTANLTVDAAADTDGEFNQGTYTQEVGDVVNFGVSSTQVDTPHVRVVDEHGALNTTFSISEGSANLTMNSYLAGNSPTGEAFSAEGGASISQVSEDSDFSAVLQPSRVNVYLYDDDPAAGGSQLDRSIIRLQERSLDGVTMWSAPSSANPSEITSAELTERSETTEGDYVVAQIQGSGLYGYMLNGSNLSDDAGLSLSLNDTATSVYGSPDGENINGSEGYVDIVPVPANDTFYVVVDPSSVNNLETGDTWSTTFTMSTANAYVTDEAESVNATFDYTARNVAFDHSQNDNDMYEVAGGQSANISGTSSLLPGTQVSVSAFFDTEIIDGTAEVGEDGSWSAELDLSEYESGDQFSIQAMESGGANTGELPAVITESDGTTGASFSVDASAPSSVEVDGDATLEYTIENTGDSAGTVNYTVTVDGEEVDTGSAELEPGNSTETMTYEEIDTSEEGEISWEVSSGNDAASGTIAVGDDTGEADETADEGDGTADEGDGGNESDDGGDGGQPGFGLVVALFALIGAALLALRRQN